MKLRTDGGPFAAACCVGAFVSLWFGFWLFHLIPLPQDLTWWAFPWALTALALAGLMFAGVTYAVRWVLWLFE